MDSAFNPDLKAIRDKMNRVNSAIVIDVPAPIMYALDRLNGRPEDETTMGMAFQPNLVFLNKGLSEIQRPRVLMHELHHVRQFADAKQREPYGEVPFIGEYFATKSFDEEYRSQRAKFGYWDSPIEREARLAERPRVPFSERQPMASHVPNAMQPSHEVNSPWSLFEAMRPGQTFAEVAPGFKEEAFRHSDEMFNLRKEAAKADWLRY